MDIKSPGLRAILSLAAALPIALLGQGLNAQPAPAGLAASRPVPLSVPLPGATVSAAVATPAPAHLAKAVSAAKPVLPLDWNQVDAEALGYFRTYLRFNTSNPPGNTAAAINWLKGILEKNGISVEIYSAQADKPNLVARLPGPPNVKPLLLMSHADVVPAVASDWSHPPFRADIAKGYVWGRGALDDKAHGIMALMTLLILKRQQVPLRRGIEMMVNSDEEVGGELGAQWMAQEHWEAIDPALALNEGGEGSSNWLGSRGITFKVAVAEKRAMWLRLIAHGRAGHGSEPNDQNPNLILVRALARLLATQPPIHLTSTVEETFAALAHRFPDPYSTALAHLGWPMMLDLAMRGPLSGYAVQALLRDTIAPTMLDAGIKANVIPSYADATLDCRLLPGTDEQSFLDHLHNRINDSRVVVEFLQKPDSGGRGSPSQGPFWDAFQEVVTQDFAGALVVPMLDASATDSRFLRARGVAAYGFIPVVLPASESSRIHGVDERLSVSNLSMGVRTTYDYATRICARP
jgi:acetylornithine deacetylase/succinyl-diaminopimelate desuccinylase-like protein